MFSPLLSKMFKVFERHHIRKQNYTVSVCVCGGSKSCDKVSLGKVRNSPPGFFCCGSWAGISTRRLCPMIRPFLLLQKLHRLFHLLLLYVFHFSPSPRVPPSSNLLKTFLRLGAGLPLPHTPRPSLLCSQHRWAVTEGCLPFLGERQVMFLICRVYRIIPPLCRSSTKKDVQGRTGRPWFRGWEFVL